MKKEFERKYHLLEEKYYWFVARRDIIVNLVGDVSRKKVLDIGCSGGALMRDFMGRGCRSVRGFDISEVAVRLCHDRGIDSTYVCDATRIGEATGSFDVAIASDVLEHIKDEDAALGEWHRVLRPGGKLVAFVPAFSFLWTAHDDANLHQRRYRKGELAARLARNGFKVLQAGYWNFSMFLPSVAMKVAQSLAFWRRNEPKKDNLLEINQRLNAFLIRVLRMENQLIGSGLNAPFGVSAYAVGTRE
ncbi:MAG: class I SAM-dependent methyltransferase [Candidatus Lokiarchaeota archaeon]|nr:class I SAM-dependent methyltransferase [Candidatus Lokiarchaeota archaeon]